MDKEKSIKKNKIIISISIVSIVIGLCLVIQPYYSMKKNVVYDKIGFQIYNSDVLNKLDEQKEDGDDSSSSSGNNKDDTEKKEEKKTDEKQGNNTSKKENNNTKTTMRYIGTIEISKIKLKKGFVSPGSKYNNIEYNVTILKGFDYPNVKNGNFILAAHSGTRPIAYFKDLYKLKVGDSVVITYDKKTYTYKIVKIYNQKKQGYVTIYRNMNKTTLTLITCTKNDKKSQTVYIAELT